MSAITGADDLEGLLVISLEQAVAAPMRLAVWLMPARG